MKKRIVMLTLIGALGCTALTACGKTEEPTGSAETQETETDEDDEDDEQEDPEDDDIIEVGEEDYDAVFEPLLGEWVYADDDMDPMYLTVYYEDGLYYYELEDMSILGSSTGTVDLFSEEHPDGSISLWYRFVDESGNEWTYFAVNEDDPYPNDIYSGQDGAMHFVRSDSEAGIDDENLDFLFEQYYNIVSGLDPEWDNFQFIYVDGDDFPEIFVTSSQPDQNDLQDYLIITHSNAGAEINEGLCDGVAGAGGYRGILYYVPGESIFYECTNDAPTNNPGNYVYLLDNGHITLYASGRTEPIDGYEGPDDIEHMIWYWNDEEVSPEDYEEILNTETSDLSGVELSSIDCMDRDSMLSALEILMN